VLQQEFEMNSPLTLLGCFFSLFLGAQAYSGHQRWILDKGQLRYKINSAYCAGVRGGVKHIGDGADIILWHCGKSSEYIWEMDGPYIRLKNNPKYCMSVREGKGGDGSDVILWSCGTNEAFKFKFENEHMKYAADERFWLSVRGNTVSDGANVILWSGHSNGFRFLMTPESHHIKQKAKTSLWWLIML